MVQGLLRTMLHESLKRKHVMNYMMTISIVALAISGFAVMSLWKS
jgi:hypothetical protein